MIADQLLDFFGIRQLWHQLAKLITDGTSAAQALATVDNPGLMSAADKQELIAIADAQIEALFPTEHVLQEGE